jgi:hypothetical protein
VNVQLSHAEARVREIQVLSSSGSVSPNAIQKLQREAEELRQLAMTNELDEVQKARLRGLGESSVAVLGEVKTRQAELDPAVETTITVVNEAVAAGLGGGVTVLAEPAPSAEGEGDEPATAAAETPATAASSDTAETPTPAPAAASGSGTPTPTATPPGSDTGQPADEEAEEAGTSGEPSSDAAQQGATATPSP